MQIQKTSELDAAGDVNCTHLAANRPKMYEQLARALSDFYETAKGQFVGIVYLFKRACLLLLRI